MEYTHTHTHTYTHTHTHTHTRRERERERERESSTKEWGRPHFCFLDDDVSSAIGVGERAAGAMGGGLLWGVLVCGDVAADRLQQLRVIAILLPEGVSDVQDTMALETLMIFDVFLNSSRKCCIFPRWWWRMGAFLAAPSCSERRVLISELISLNWANKKSQGQRKWTTIVFGQSYLQRANPLDILLDLQRQGTEERVNILLVKVRRRRWAVREMGRLDVAVAQLGVLHQLPLHFALQPPRFLPQLLPRHSTCLVPTPHTTAAKVRQGSEGRETLLLHTTAMITCECVRWRWVRR